MSTSKSQQTTPNQQQENLQQGQQQQEQQQQQQQQQQQLLQEQSEIDGNQSTEQTTESQVGCWYSEGEQEMVSGQKQGQGQGQGQGQAEKRKGVASEDVPWEEMVRQSDVALQELKRPKAVVVPDANYQVQQQQRPNSQQGVQILDLQQIGGGEHPWAANFPFIYQQALQQPPPEEILDVAFGIPVNPLFMPDHLTSYTPPNINALQEENQKYQQQQNMQFLNTQRENNNGQQQVQEEDAKENFDQNFGGGGTYGSSGI